MQRIKKLTKLLIRLLLFSLLALLLFAVLLQIPIVQQHLVGRLENYLHNKLKTEVRLQSIQLRLPESLVVEGVYIEDLHQDTLLDLEEMALNFKLNKLLNRRIQFDKITLKGGNAKIYMAQDSANFDFVVAAFAGKPSQKDSTNAWTLTFDDASLQATDIDFQFVDVRNALAISTHLGQVKGAIEQIDLSQNKYQLDHLQLSNSRMYLDMGETSANAKENSTSVVDYWVDTKQMDLQAVFFKLKMPDLNFSTQIDRLNSKAVSFNLTAAGVALDLANIAVRESNFQYDIPTAAPSDGFDYKHLDLQELNGDIAHFKYTNGIINANITQFSGREKEGLALENLQAIFDFSEEEIRFQNLYFKTAQSYLRSQNTQLQFPSASQNGFSLQQLTVKSDLVARLKNLSDIRYFYPALDSIAFLKNAARNPLTIQSNLQGSINDLLIDFFRFDGLDTQVHASGKLKNLLQSDQLKWDINLHQLNANGKDLYQLLPPNVLSDYIQLPDSLVLSGQSNGNLQDFQAQIIAQTNRQNAPFPSQIIASASIQNISDLERAYFDLQLDTVHTSKADLLAYLPPDIIPTYVSLPQSFILAGQIKGQTANLQSDLQLLTYRDKKSNQIQMLGGVSNLFTNQKPVFDIAMNAPDISAQELAAFLPDSLLPAYFKLPFIRKLTGVFKGDLENFSTNFQLEANTGYWSVDASLEQEQYHLDLQAKELQAASFFTPGYLDSIAGFSLLPLSVELQLSGQGFDTSPSAASDILLTIKNAADTTMAGLVIQGKLEEQLFTANALAQERKIDLQSNLTLDFSPAIPEWSIDLDLNRLDMKLLQLSANPFWLNGRLNGQVKGYDLDTLNGVLLFSDWGIHFEDKWEQIDSLQLRIDFDNSNNSASVASDFFDTELKGVFQFSSAWEALQQQVNHYWQPDHPRPLVGKTEDRFDWNFTLHRPEILTMGFIPGLEELSPFKIQSSYDNRKSLIDLKTDLPHLRWNDIQLDDLYLQTNGLANTLDYNLQFREAMILGYADIINGQISGTMKDQTFHNNILLLDEQKEKRFEIKSAVSLLGEQGIRWTLSPEQFLDYQKWGITPNNAIHWSPEQLSVEDWRLFTATNAIEISQSEPEQLAVLFEDFDLKVIVGIIQLNSNYLGGILNGKLQFTNPLKQVSITSALTIDSLMVMNAQLGDLKINATNEKERVITTAIQLQGNGNDLDLKGDFDIDKTNDALDLQLNIQALNLQSIEPLTFGFLENMAGKFEGKIQVRGSLQRPLLAGQIRADQAAFDVEMVKARLRLGSQAILFDENGLEFKDLEIFDANGQKGIVSSYLLTENYRDFFLQSNLKVKDFLVLNTQAKDNNLYYGQLLVDANVDLSGNIMEPTIEVTAKPKKGSDFTYVYTSTANGLESHEGIVEFVVPEIKEEATQQKLIPVSNDLNMKIVVKMAIDEDLKFKAITDPITGDYFEGKAKGDLVYVQQPDGTMELTGSLEVIEGDYLFTYQELIRRPFKVKPGGTINWIGDPFNPSLNIDVAYEVRTSVYPLLVGSSGTDANDNNASLKQTFGVNLNFGGTLSKTDITASLEYPDGNGNSNNAEVKAAINRINQDPNQQNTQAFALILFNGFLAQNLENSKFQIVDITGNINNMITQQLNGLANRYIKFVELDFGLDTYDNNDNTSTTGLRVGIRKRFLNDRLTISLDGKTTEETGNNDGTSQNYLDNVSVEYALTPDGQFKIKIYNKRDYDDFIGGTGVKVGGAFVFSKDFNEVKLFGRKKK